MIAKANWNRSVAVGRPHRLDWRTLRIESLEPRTVLSANTLLSDGLLQVQGTGQADQIEALVVFDSLAVRVNNQWVVYPNRDVEQIHVLGRAGADVIRMHAGVVQPTRIEGGMGDDWIQGSRQNDEILGGSGNDCLFGLNGADLIDGGLGNDRVYGGAGDDFVQGGLGNDVLHGGAGRDTLAGDVATENWSSDPSALELLLAGHDWLYGGFDDDLLYGQAGQDHLYGGHGDDQLHGGHGDDRLSGGNGGDILLGGAGNDWLWGNLGDDELNGGAGNDFLFGGWGDDRLRGGDGADLVSGEQGRDYLDGDTGRDIIFAVDTEPDTIQQDASDWVLKDAIDELIES